MARKRWSKQDDHQVAALQAQGLTLRQIAKQLDVAPGTVSKHAKKIGVKFDRAQTRQAANAKNADAAALRARLKLDLLHDAQRLRNQLFAPTTVYSFGGKDNDFNEQTLAIAPADVQRNIMTSIGIAVQRSIELERVDQKTEVDKPAVDKWLESLGVAA